MNFNYINIDTHGASYEPDTLVIHNLYPEQYISDIAYRYGTVGMHPWKLQTETAEQEFEILAQASTNNNIIAIGETGLDKACQTDFSLQKRVFEKHLEIAASVNKPVIIHCVRSYDEILEYVSEFKQLSFIFHWFYADLHITKKLVKLPNTYFSFGHTLLELSKKTKLNLAEIPLNRLFLETDDSGHSIIQIYQAASTLLYCEMPELQQKIKDNFEAVFGNQIKTE